MVLALIVNIGLSALVFGIIIAMLVRGIHMPVRRAALIGESRRPRPATPGGDRARAHSRGTQRLDVARSMDA